MSGEFEDFNPDPTHDEMWECRRWQAAVAAMTAAVNDNGHFPSFQDAAIWAIRTADALIAEYRKTESTK